MKTKRKRYTAELLMERQLHKVPQFDLRHMQDYYVFKKKVSTINMALTEGLIDVDELISRYNLADFL